MPSPVITRDPQLYIAIATYNSRSLLKPRDCLSQLAIVFDHALCTYQCNAGGGGEGEARHGVPAGGGGGGTAWGGDLTFFKNLQSNSLPTGKSFQSNATKFPHPRLHIAVNPKAEPKKGTIKISPNKTLQSHMFPLQLQLYVLTITRVTLRRIHKP